VLPNYARFVVVAAWPLRRPLQRPCYDIGPRKAERPDPAPGRHGDLL